MTPPKKLDTSQYLRKGLFPIIDQSQSFVCGWTDDTEALVHGTFPMIVFGDHTCVLKLVSRPFAQGADGIKIITATGKVTTEYLYQALNFRPLKGEDYKRHFGILKDKAVAFPDVKTGEQQKIADCLTSLDDLIAAEERKLGALRRHKDGLVGRLFPREGKTVPDLRFPEFRTAAEWERVKLSNLLFETKQRNRKLEYDANAVLSVSGEFGCVNQIELLGRSYAGASVKEYKIVKPGDVVYTKSPLKKNPYGIIKANKGKAGIVSTLYAVYGVRGPNLPNFIDLYFSSDFRLNSYLQPIVRKGAKNDMKVNNEDVLTGTVCVPKPDEQRRISDLIDSLDALILTQTKKLDRLKGHKRGMMQGLFPAMEGA